MILLGLLNLAYLANSLTTNTLLGYPHCSIFEDVTQYNPVTKTRVYVIPGRELCEVDAFPSSVYPYLN